MCSLYTTLYTTLPMHALCPLLLSLVAAAAVGAQPSSAYPPVERPVPAAVPTAPDQAVAIPRLVLAPTPVETRAIAPTVAVGTSVATTATAIGIGLTVDVDDGTRALLIVLGAAAGPSAGNLIQGEWADAGMGLGLRAGGAALLLGAAAGSLWNDSETQRIALGGVGVVGGLVSVSGVLYEVITAGTNASSRRVQVAPAGAGLAVTVGL